MASLVPTPGNPYAQGVSLARPGNPTGFQDVAAPLQGIATQIINAAGASITAPGSIPTATNMGRGTNQRIVYSRVVPLSVNPTMYNGTHHSFVAPSDKLGGKPTTLRLEVDETTSLKDNELAFVLGSKASMLPGTSDKLDTKLYKNLDFRRASVVNRGSASDQLVRLASFEYVSAFFRSCFGKMVKEVGSDLWLGHVVSPFYGLHKWMGKNGANAFKPDSVIVNRLVSPAGDPSANAALDSRHGILFNACVKGPTTLATFAGGHESVVMPGDKLYIVVVADLVAGDAGSVTSYTQAVDQLFDEKTAKGAEQTMSEYKMTDADKKAGYQKLRTIFKSNRGKFCNFRLMKMNTYRLSKYGEFEDGYCGMRYGIKGASAMCEVVLGGWQIGTVMDSRAIKDDIYIGRTRVATQSVAQVNVDIKPIEGSALMRKVRKTKETAEAASAAASEADPEAETATV
jgi:hypothetical protein